MKLKVKCTNCGTEFTAYLIEGDLLTDISCTNCEEKTLVKDSE